MGSFAPNQTDERISVQLPPSNPFSKSIYNSILVMTIVAINPYESHEGYGVVLPLEYLSTLTVGDTMVSSH
jgi:hypothetical protein